MGLGQPRDFFFAQSIQQWLKRLAVQRAVRPVKAFETLEQQKQPLQVPALELVVLAIDRVCYRVGDLVLLDEIRDFVNVSRPRLKTIVKRWIDPIDEHVQLAVVLGK